MEVTLKRFPIVKAAWSKAQFYSCVCARILTLQKMINNGPTTPNHLFKCESVCALASMLCCLILQYKTHWLFNIVIFFLLYCIRQYNNISLTANISLI